MILCGLLTHTSASPPPLYTIYNLSLVWLKHPLCDHRATHCWPVILAQMPPCFTHSSYNIPDPLPPLPNH